MLLLHADTQHGYQEIVGEDQKHIQRLNFALLRLGEGEKYVGETNNREVVLVLLEGDAEVEVDGVAFKNLHRDSPFKQKATAIYAPIQSTYEIRNTGTRSLEVAVCSAYASTRYAPFIVRPEEVSSRKVGRDNWCREVDDIVVQNAEGRVHRIIVGETFNEPGNWSSYPPHKHDNYKPGVEACMEEIYHYRLDPQQGFGLQLIYTDDRSLDEAYPVRDRDTFLIPKGYHPVIAAAGYRLYYLWIMAGDIDRVMIPNDDPNHAWVKQQSR